MKLIALMGKSKSGKDTVGTMLKEQAPQVWTMAFADKLKAVCMDVFKLTHADVYDDAGKGRPLPLIRRACPSCGSADVEVLTATKQGICRKCNLLAELQAYQTMWTPRMILQHIGTEGFRAVDPDVWVKIALEGARQVLVGPDAEAVVITDCRFRSEADAVWAAGGQVWRIRRPDTDLTAQGLTDHPSEREMETIPDTLFQQVLHNNSGLDELRVKVETALASFRVAVGQP